VTIGANLLPAIRACIRFSAAWTSHSLTLAAFESTFRTDPFVALLATVVPSTGLAILFIARFTKEVWLARGTDDVATFPTNIVILAFIAKYIVAEVTIKAIVRVHVAIKAAVSMVTSIAPCHRPAIRTETGITAFAITSVGAFFVCAKVKFTYGTEAPFLIIFTARFTIFLVASFAAKNV